MRELDVLLDQFQIAAIHLGRELKRLEAADIRTGKRLEERGLQRWRKWLSEMEEMGRGLPL